MRLRVTIEIENTDAEVEALERELNCSTEEMIERLNDPASAENHGMRSEFVEVLGEGVKSFKVEQVDNS